MPARKGWTQKELDYVVTHRGALNLAAVGRRLGRSQRSVESALARSGLSVPRDPPGEWEANLHRLHASGLWDSELARALGWGRGTVQRRRKRLGLAANPAPPEVQKERYRRQMANSEANNLVDLRWRPVRVAQLLSPGSSES